MLAERREKLLSLCKKNFKTIEEFTTKFETKVANQGYFQILPYPPELGKETKPYVKLWRAVIDRALLEVLQSKKTLRHFYRTKETLDSAYPEVLHWIYGTHEDDFVQVCDFAFLEPHEVRETFKFFIRYKQELKYNNDNNHA